MVVGGSAVVVAVAVAGWIWSRSGPLEQDLPLPGASLTPPVADHAVSVDRPVSNEQLAAAIKEIKNRLRPDEVRLTGPAEELLRKQVETLQASVTQLRSELDAARRARDTLLEDNHRLASANRALQARAAAGEQALLPGESRPDRLEAGPDALPSSDATEPDPSASAPSSPLAPPMPTQLVAQDTPRTGPEGRLRILVRMLDADVSRDGSRVTVPLTVAFDPATDELTPASSPVLTRLAELARLYGAKAVHVSLFRRPSADQGKPSALLQRHARSLSDALAATYGVGAAVTATIEPAPAEPQTAGAIEVELRR